MPYLFRRDDFKVACSVGRQAAALLQGAVVRDNDCAIHALMCIRALFGVSEEAAQQVDDLLLWSEQCMLLAFLSMRVIELLTKVCVLLILSLCISM